MSSMALLHWPAWILLASALLFALLAFRQGVVCRRCARDYRRMAATWRFLLLIVFLGLAVLLAGGGMALRGYRFLGAELPVINIAASQLGPQRYQLALTWPDGSVRNVLVQGDAWRVDAVVLKWELPAVLAGVPPVYRLDRLAGRYADIEQARSTPPSVVALEGGSGFDAASLSLQHGKWLPMVDTVYGSSVYLPLEDGGRYQVSVMATGALVARQSN